MQDTLRTDEQEVNHHGKTITVGGGSEVIRKKYCFFGFFQFSRMPIKILTLMDALLMSMAKKINHRLMM